MTHHWFCEFGDAGDGTGCEKEFNLPHLKERTQDVDTSRAPVAMIINSSELRPAGFKLKEVYLMTCAHQDGTTKA